MKATQIIKEIDELWSEVRGSQMNSNLKDDICMELGRATDAIRRASQRLDDFNRANSIGGPMMANLSVGFAPND